MNIYKKIFILLDNRWGDQKWWPADSRLEIIIGAILTQNTSWKNVEQALSNLKKNNKISISKISNASHKELASLIKPAGYYNQKSKYIIGVVNYIKKKYNGSLDELFSLDLSLLRKELLSLKGIGPETADTIILYASQKPIFVIDTYTRRFMERHQLASKNDSYDSLAKKFTDSLPRDYKLYNQFHALIVQLGKNYCKTKAKCSGCPLEKLY